MKGIVFGKGYLGTRISQSLNYTLVGRPEIDLLNFNDLSEFLDKEKPDVVINAAGITGRPNIDWCELNKEETVLGNISAALNLSMLCSKKNIYFVHLSSGCVYHGNNNENGFSEDDEPNFYNYQFYAKTKIISEKILKEFPGLILRIRLPVDNRPNERNLIDKIKKYKSVL